MSLWKRALRAYAAPGVEALCLALQDADGQSVAYLLWALWAEEDGRAVDRPLAERAAALAASYEAGVLRPLRAKRRALKAGLAAATDTDREGERERLKADELAAERLLLQALEAQTPPPSGARGALGAALAAWAPPAPKGRLSDLAGGFSKTAFSATNLADMSFSDEPPLANDEAIHARIAELRQAHQDLDDAVRALSAKSVPDQLQIARLKKQKLALRDQITRLEDRLTPDIIA
ncbi:MAG TPA: TIGR02444 family protein [Caulobacteraceae bacterium]|nr:TIGR02444 family protein [Caulobacteraceae bacterium]